MTVMMTMVIWDVLLVVVKMANSVVRNERHLLALDLMRTAWRLVNEQVGIYLVVVVKSVSNQRILMLLLPQKTRRRHSKRKSQHNGHWSKSLRNSVDEKVWTRMRCSVKHMENQMRKDAFPLWMKNSNAVWNRCEQRQRDSVVGVVLVRRQRRQHSHKVMCVVVCLEQRRKRRKKRQQHLVELPKESCPRHESSLKRLSQRNKVVPN
jgi:hypothetical protein